MIGKADDAIEFVRDKPVSVILDLLISIYGTVDDPEDLKVEFYQHYQEEKELTSDYLTELFLDVTEIVSLGGIDPAELSKELVKQFCRGTHDEEMLTKLHIEEASELYGRSMQFSELFKNVRKEEARRTQRRLKHKKKIKPQSQVQVVSEGSSEILQKIDARLANLEEQQKIAEKKTGLEVGIAQLNSRLTQLESVNNASLLTEEDTSVTAQVNRVKEKKESQERVSRKSDVFCYRCGQDFHFATDCRNPPNKALVKEKAEARKARRSQQENA